MHRIFDKTDKGREEIATRKYRLAPRLRTLLLLIDGKQTTGQLLQKIAGLDETSITELLDGEFIQAVQDEDDADEAAGDIITVMPIEADQRESAAEATEETTQEAATTDEAESETFSLPEGETKFQAIQKFYSENIRTTLGLRGYNFQLKVDQAESVDDLRALHDPYIAAVLKAKGDVVARDLHLRLEQLFSLEDVAADTESE
jgi:hypothetical protein